MNCGQPGCTGTITDGYCDDCGMAPERVRSNATEVLGRAADGPPRVLAAAGPATVVPSRSPASASTSPSTTATRRTRLGAGLVEIPPVPTRDPETAVMADPHVAEHRRFCGSCDERVGRSRDGRPGRTEGFCAHCAAPFSFTATLRRGDVVGGQYEIRGCLAHGGLGWIYLARDRRVADRWVVLKGLLDRGDEQAMAVAVAERRFLAEVEHPNIVKIHNFVEHDGDGYIVMEFVNGTSLREVLEARRAANGGRADPLPVGVAISFCLEILPAIGHLHDLGLAYCDFKPDNVIHTSGSSKLIDLGGVYRMDDRTSPVYGTVGFQAPEIAETGPTRATDLFTVGRTLAVLCTDFAGYQSTYRFTLPAPADVELYRRHDSLHRFLLRATAYDPDTRFQTAEEMSAQLLGVLREIVAGETGRPAPGVSTTFTAPGRGSTETADWRALPTPLVDPDDPLAALILSIGPAGPDAIAEQRAAVQGSTSALDLWLARSLIDDGRLDDAAVVLDAVGQADPGDWRVHWYRGVGALAAGTPGPARHELERVLDALPGELAPKLALGVATELAGAPADAVRWYEIVSRTDPGFTSAAFGLARCHAALGDRAAAAVAYGRVPDTSSAHVDARVAEARLLVTDGAPLADVQRAAGIVEQLPLDAEQRGVLVAQILEAALGILDRGGRPDPAVLVAGFRFTDRDVRRALEATYRAAARRAAGAAERIALVDRANTVRPRTLV